MSNEYFKLISNCIPVKGFNQSLICDLHRKNYCIIPNDLYDILIEYEGCKIIDIKDFYDNKYDEIIDEYFEFLLENEFIFFTNTPNWFPKMDLKFDFPFQISNAIIDIDNNSSYDIYKLISQLEDLNCKSIEIRYFKEIDVNDFNELITLLNTNKSIISSIGILIPYSKSFLINIKTKETSFARLTYVIFYNSDVDKVITLDKNHDSVNLIFTNDFMASNKCCGVVNEMYFTLSIKSFTESLKHNSCLNRKISIDVEGNIKNCPSMPKDFGNIKNITLQKALEHRDFKKYWNITKDQIDICKDCEFRYICTDCRAYRENPEDDYSKPLKCGYDPYTNVWEEWSTNPLKQKTIEHYDMTDLVKKND